MQRSPTAAQIANRYKPCARALRALWAEARPLVGEDQWLTAVLRDAREGGE